MSGRRDWRDGVEEMGEEGSIFQADLLCSTCTEAACKEIEASGKAPEDPDDESSYDSDDYPKRVDLTREESDNPQHCGSHEGCLAAIELPSGSKVGAWLGGSLTSEGIAYVQQAVHDGLYARTPHRREIGRLWRQLYVGELDGKALDEVDVARLPLRRVTSRCIAAYADLDSIYQLYEEGRDEILVERSIADPEGRLKVDGSVRTARILWEDDVAADVLRGVIDDEW